MPPWGRPHWLQASNRVAFSSQSVRGGEHRHHPGISGTNATEALAPQMRVLPLRRDEPPPHVAP